MFSTVECTYWLILISSLFILQRSIYWKWKASTVPEILLRQPHTLETSVVVVVVVFIVVLVLMALFLFLTDIFTWLELTSFPICVYMFATCRSYTSTNKPDKGKECHKKMQFAYILLRVNIYIIFTTNYLYWQTWRKSDISMGNEVFKMFDYINHKTVFWTWVTHMATLLLSKFLTLKTISQQVHNATWVVAAIASTAISSSIVVADCVTQSHWWIRVTCLSSWQSYTTLALTVVLWSMSYIVMFIMQRHLTQMKFYIDGIFSFIYRDEYSFILNIKADIFAENKSKPKVFLCTTMYREAEYEMQVFINSLKIIAASDNMHSIDLENHIFIDNGIEQTQMNSFAKQFIRLLEKQFLEYGLGSKSFNTPYGMQIQGHINENIPLYIHLKDSTKVKAKKRWSQIMYFSYILKFRHSKPNQISKEKHILRRNINELSAATLCMDIERQHIDRVLGTSNLINELDVNEDFAVDDGTHLYILATDADMQFTDKDLLKLVKVCEENPSYGGACGRTHPISKSSYNPLVWFQKFEYAKGIYVLVKLSFILTIS